MESQFKDTISPVAKTIGNDPRRTVLKKYAVNISSIYDHNSGKFKGTSAVFKEYFQDAIKKNLWELCYFMIENTAYIIPESFYKKCLATAQKEGSITFMYALMDFASSSGIQIFPDMTENKQREHLANITTPVYGMPIGSFLQDEREQIFKGL